MGQTVSSFIGSVGQVSQAGLEICKVAEVLINIHTKMTDALTKYQQFRLCTDIALNSFGNGDCNGADPENPQQAIASADNCLGKLVSCNSNLQSMDSSLSGFNNYLDKTTQDYAKKAGSLQGGTVGFAVSSWDGRTEHERTGEVCGTDQVKLLLDPGTPLICGPGWDLRVRKEAGASGGTSDDILKAAQRADDALTALDGIADQLPGSLTPANVDNLNKLKDSVKSTYLPAIKTNAQILKNAAGANNFIASNSDSLEAEANNLDSNINLLTQTILKTSISRMRQNVRAIKETANPTTLYQSGETSLKGALGVSGKWQNAQGVFNSGAGRYTFTLNCPKSGGQSTPVSINYEEASCSGINGRRAAQIPPAAAGANGEVACPGGKPWLVAGGKMGVVIPAVANSKGIQSALTLDDDGQCVYKSNTDTILLLVQNKLTDPNPNTEPDEPIEKCEIAWRTTQPSTEISASDTTPNNLADYDFSKRANNNKRLKQADLEQSKIDQIKSPFAKRLQTTYTGTEGQVPLVGRVGGFRTATIQYTCEDRPTDRSSSTTRESKQITVKIDSRWSDREIGIITGVPTVPSGAADAPVAVNDVGKIKMKDLNVGDKIKFKAERGGQTLTIKNKVMPSDGSIVTLTFEEKGGETFDYIPSSRLADYYIETYVPTQKSQAAGGGVPGGTSGVKINSFSVDTNIKSVSVTEKTYPGASRVGFKLYQSSDGTEYSVNTDNNIVTEYGNEVGTFRNGQIVFDKIKFYATIKFNSRYKVELDKRLGLGIIVKKYNGDKVAYFVRELSGGETDSEFTLRSNDFKGNDKKQYIFSNDDYDASATIYVFGLNDAKYDQNLVTSDSVKFTVGGGGAVADPPKPRLTIDKISQAPSIIGKGQELELTVAGSAYPSDRVALYINFGNGYTRLGQAETDQQGKYTITGTNVPYAQIITPSPNIAVTNLQDTNLRIEQSITIKIS